MLRHNRIITNTIDNDIDLGEPAKIKSCHCEQCRRVKNKRKNRRLKRKIKRLLNKKRRNNKDVIINHYWA